ncbi:MAG TPA: hypothetical protein VGM30_08575 [Puia sp.]|jgi:hypothetical protein
MKKITGKLTLVMIAGATLAICAPSCKKSSNGGPSGPTPIGGFVSSDSVEPANLIAYWPMDGNGTDVKGGANATGVNVTYVTGVRGQAYQGATNAYASFTPNAAMVGLQSFSLAFWYWQPAQPIGTPNTPQGMFFLADAGGANPDIIVENEHYAPVSRDSVSIHAGLTFPKATNYKGFTMATFDTVAIGKWVHFAMTYDGGSSTYVVYQNGQAMLNSSAYGNLASTILLDGPTGSTPQGNINWSANPPVEGTIGAWAPGVYGVSNTLGLNGNFVGKLDEIRLFKVALTSKEVAGLYLNGQAGR